MKGWKESVWLLNQQYLHSQTVNLLRLTEARRRQTERQSSSSRGSFTNTPYFFLLVLSLYKQAFVARVPDTLHTVYPLQFVRSCLWIHRDEGSKQGGMKRGSIASSNHCLWWIQLHLLGHVPPPSASPTWKVSVSGVSSKTCRAGGCRELNAEWYSCCSCEFFIVYSIKEKIHMTASVMFLSSLPGG